MNGFTDLERTLIEDVYMLIELFYKMDDSLQTILFGEVVADSIVIDRATAIGSHVNQCLSRMGVDINGIPEEVNELRDKGEFSEAVKLLEQYVKKEVG